MTDTIIRCSAVLSSISINKQYASL